MARLDSFDRRRAARIMRPVISKAFSSPRAMLVLVGPVLGGLTVLALPLVASLAIGVLATAGGATAAVVTQTLATPGLGPRVAGRFGLRYIPAQRHYSRRSPRVGFLLERAQAGHLQRAISGLSALATDKDAGRIERLDATLAIAEIRGWPTTDETTTATRVDVVMISDFGLGGGTTSSNITEIRAQRAAGLSTILVHNRSPKFLDEGPDPRVLALLDDQVRFLGSGERIECDVLLLKYPPSALELPDALERIHVRGDVVVIMNQTPRTGYGRESHEVYDIGSVDQEIRRVLHKEPVWIPIGPAVRDVAETNHADDLTSIRWSDDYWHELIDTAAWRRAGRRPSVDGKTVIGRHGRDSVWKWPNTATDILTAYPNEPRHRVEILGGAKTPQKILRRLPANWVVHEFGSMSPRDFLHGLDVFVYFPHPDMTEAFGRTILEALAVGVPVVTDERFVSLFGEAVIARPIHQAQQAIEHLVGDPDEYDAAVRRGWALVAERFDVQRHLDRLRRFSVAS